MTIRSFVLQQHVYASSDTPLVALTNNSGADVVVTAVQFAGAHIPSLKVERYDAAITTESATSTGMTFTAGSATVMGSGTAFLTKFRAGNFVRLSADTDDDYTQILAIDDDEQLTLAAPYPGTGGTGTGQRRTESAPTAYCANAPGTSAGVTTYSVEAATITEPDPSGLTFAEEVYLNERDRALPLLHDVHVPAGDSLVIETTDDFAGYAFVLVQVAFTKDIP